MALTPQDTSRIAQLARLELSPTEAPEMLAQLNDFFKVVEQMRAVDTSGVAPLSHPIAAWKDDVELRLREDKVTELNRRDDYQQPAPATQDGLYLVPKVID